MSNESPQHEKKRHQGPSLKLMAIATLGFVVGEQLLLNFYPEIHNIICASSVVLVGGGLTIKFSSFMSKVNKQKMEMDAKYYEAYPEQSPAFKKAVREKAKAERVQRKRELADAEERVRRSIEDRIANDSTLLSYMDRLSAAKERNNKKLIHNYKKLINTRKKELKRKFNY